MGSTSTTRRRTVLKTFGSGVVGGLLLTGRAAADVDSGPILLDDLSFNPATYHADTGTVTWEHADTSFAGMVHNVHIHEHGNEGNRLMSSGALELGDTYVVSFSLVDGRSTLRLSDGNQTTDVAVDGRTDIEFGVHCDFHEGSANIEGTMKMDEFLVHL